MCINPQYTHTKERKISKDIGIDYRIRKSELSGNVDSNETPNMYKLCIVLKNYKKGELFTVKEVKNCFVSIQVGSKGKLLRTKAYIQPYSLFQFLMEHNLVNTNNIFFVPLLNPTTKSDIIVNSLARLSRLIFMISSQKYEMMESAEMIILWNRFKAKVRNEKVDNLKVMFGNGIAYLENILSMLLKFPNPFDSGIELYSDAQVNNLSTIIDQIDKHFNSYMLHKKIM
jgi:hypothetical protein